MFNFEDKQYLYTNHKQVIFGVELRANNKDKYLDLSNYYFILLGATSAMGPVYFLLSYGANIIAVDLDRPNIWNKLFQAVKDSPGRLIFPVKKDVANPDKLSQSELA